MQSEHGTSAYITSEGAASHPRPPRVTDFESSLACSSTGEGRKVAEQLSKPDHLSYSSMYLRSKTLQLAQELVKNPRQQLEDDPSSQMPAAVEKADLSSATVVTIAVDATSGKAADSLEEQEETHQEKDSALNSSQSFSAHVSLEEIADAPLSTIYSTEGDLTDQGDLLPYGGSQQHGGASGAPSVHETSLDGFVSARVTMDTEGDKLFEAEGEQCTSSPQPEVMLMAGDRPVMTPARETRQRMPLKSPRLGLLTSLFGRGQSSNGGQSSANAIQKKRINALLKKHEPSLLRSLLCPLVATGSTTSSAAPSLAGDGSYRGYASRETTSPASDSALASPLVSPVPSVSHSRQSTLDLGGHRWQLSSDGLALELEGLSEKIQESLVQNKDSAVANRAFSLAWSESLGFFLKEKKDEGSQELRILSEDEWKQLEDQIHTVEVQVVSDGAERVGTVDKYPRLTLQTESASSTPYATPRDSDSPEHGSPSSPDRVTLGTWREAEEGPEPIQADFFTPRETAGEEEEGEGIQPCLWAAVDREAVERLMDGEGRASADIKDTGERPDGAAEGFDPEGPGGCQGDSWVSRSRVTLSKLLAAACQELTAGDGEQEGLVPPAGLAAELELVDAPKRAIEEVPRPQTAREARRVTSITTPRSPRSPRVRRKTTAAPVKPQEALTTSGSFGPWDGSIDSSDSSWLEDESCDTMLSPRGRMNATMPAELRYSRRRTSPASEAGAAAQTAYQRIIASAGSQLSSPRKAPSPKTPRTPRRTAPAPPIQRLTTPPDRLSDQQKKKKNPKTPRSAASRQKTPGLSPRVSRRPTREEQELLDHYVVDEGHAPQLTDVFPKGRPQPQAPCEPEDEEIVGVVPDKGSLSSAILLAKERGNDGSADAPEPAPEARSAELAAVEKEIKVKLVARWWLKRSTSRAKASTGGSLLPWSNLAPSPLRNMTPRSLGYSFQQQQQQPSDQSDDLTEEDSFGLDACKVPEIAIDKVELEESSCHEEYAAHLFRKWDVHNSEDNLFDDDEQRMADAEELPPLVRSSSPPESPRSPRSPEPSGGWVVGPLSHPIELFLDSQAKPAAKVENIKPDKLWQGGGAEPIELQEEQCSSEGEHGDNDSRAINMSVEDLMSSEVF